MQDREMTLGDLQEQMWKQLPVFRRNMVGRERVNDLVMIAVEQCPVEYCMATSRGGENEKVLLAAWGQSVKRGYSAVCGSTDEKRFGPIFLIVISTFIQILLQKLLEWWWESSKNRVLMAGWRRRLTGD